jgi:hypothetical protein
MEAPVPDQVGAVLVAEGVDTVQEGDLGSGHGVGPRASWCSAQSYVLWKRRGFSIALLYIYPRVEVISRVERNYLSFIEPYFSYVFG